MLEQTNAACKAKRPDEPCGTTVVIRPAISTDSNTPVIPGVPTTSKPSAMVIRVDVSDQESVKKACGEAAAGLAQAENGEDPLLARFAAVGGAYYCDAYLKAAARRDPLLIIGPQLVPIAQLSSDIQGQLAKMLPMPTRRPRRPPPRS